VTPSGDSDQLIKDIVENMEKKQWNQICL
jgi:hypothetical protein